MSVVPVTGPETGKMALREPEILGIVSNHDPRGQSAGRGLMSVLTTNPSVAFLPRSEGNGLANRRLPCWGGGRPRMVWM
jgi:hypothetical protein